MAAAVALVVYALAFLRLVVIPAIVALLLATVALPVVNVLQRRGLHRSLATLLVIVVSIGSFVGLVLVLAPTVGDQFGDLGPTLSDARVEIEDWLVEGPLDLSRADIDRYTEQVGDQASGRGEVIAEGVVSGARLVFEVIVGILLVIVLVFFFVKDGDRMCAFALRQLRQEHHDLARSLGRRVWAVLQGYVRGTAIVALVDATVIGIGLAIIGVPLVVPLVILTFFGAFFPLVGATVAGVVAVLVALVTQGPGDALLAGGLVILVQQVEGDVLAPLVLGKAVALHPVVILLVLTAGAIVGGLAGAFLAVPVAAVAVAVGSELRRHGLIGPERPDQPEPVA